MYLYNLNNNKMGRPQAVSYKTFHKYDKLHTEKSKMYCGVELITLYPIKETPQFYISPEVWAYCASKFKRKKKNLEQLRVDIPVLTDEQAVATLKRKAWKDKEFKGDQLEAVEFIKKLYPDHVYQYYYEFENILSGYNHGAFVRYDDQGNEAEPYSCDIERRKQHTHDFYKWYASNKNAPAELTKLWDEYHNYRKDDGRSNYSEEKKSELFSKWYDAERDYVYEHFDMTKILRTICEHSVCLPMAFKDGTADWHKEKYGRVCAYAHAGEVFFVVTEDIIYFTVTRHF